MKKYLLFWLFVFVSQLMKAQLPADTLRLSLPQAEKIFLEKNLYLLAEQYNVPINEALVQQAKLWDNPQVVLDQNLYDGKFFRHDKDNGQFYIQIQQLIRTANKRSKLAQLSIDNITLAKGQFDALLRSLRIQLQSDFLAIQGLMKNRLVYLTEISEVEKLVAGMNEEYKQGNISLKDNMRLKALLFGLQNELVNVQSQLMPLEAEVQLILQESPEKFILPVFEYQLPAIIHATIPTKDSLITVALINRPEINLAKSALLYQEHNLTYQKALAKPDITIGPSFDKRNSYAPNYVGFAVSLPLNVFNKNQGNIKSAAIAIKQQGVVKDIQSEKIVNEVANARQQFLYYQQINNDAQLSFSREYEALFKNMLSSYKDKQIGLLELIDFIDAYRDSKLKLIDQHQRLIQAAQQLNEAVNTSVIQIK